MKTKYNKSNVLKNAWRILRASKNELSWSECLKQSWNIEKNGMSLPTFDAIYKKYYNMVYSQVIQKVKRVEDAEEIVNDVFLKCHKHINDYDVYRAKLSTWLYNIAKNTIIDFYKRDNSGKRVNTKCVNIESYVNEDGDSYFEIADTSISSAEVENTELQEKINKVLNTLKPKHREIAVLGLIKQLKYEEIAQTLDIPLNTVKVTLMRAKAKMQEQLQDYYEMYMS